MLGRGLDLIGAFGLQFMENLESDTRLMLQDYPHLLYYGNSVHLFFVFSLITKKLKGKGSAYQQFCDKVCIQFVVDYSYIYSNLYPTLPLLSHVNFHSKGVANNYTVVGDCSYNI